MRDVFWVAIEAGTSLFEVLLIFMFLNGFLVKKEIPFIKKAVIFAAAYLMQFSISAWFSYINYLMLFSTITIAIAASITLYVGKIYVRLFSPLLQVAMMMLFELISMLFVMSIFDLSSEGVVNQPIFKLIGCVIKNILNFIAIKAIVYFRKSDTGNISSGYRFLLMIVPASSLLIAYAIMDLVKKLNNEDSSLAMVGLLGLMYINAIIFAIFESYMRQLDKEYRYKLTEKQLDLQLVHYNQLAENRAHIREIWHDFKNHVNCMQILYDNNDRESLGEYIRNLSHIEETSKVIDTGNPVIDALLNNKQSIAAKGEIKLEAELNIPSGLSISPADICVVLGNSLDNAIEASNRIRNPEILKCIDLSMDYKNGYLVISISNNFEEKPKRQGKQFRTWKSSPEMHGLGMQSIERTVRQYGGNMKVAVGKGVFKLEILMAVKPHEGAGSLEADRAG